MTPESNWIPGLPDQQWSSISWESFVVTPTMLRPARPCSAASRQKQMAVKVTRAEAQQCQQPVLNYKETPLLGLT